jgi:hypothetical protein
MIDAVSRSNLSSTTPKITFGKRVAQTATYQLHSSEILQRRHKLSPIHSTFITLTETPLKAIGSILTVILAPLAGIKLFNGSNSSSDSIFNSWKFLAPLALGAVTSFGANSYLSSNKSGDSAPAVKPPEKLVDNTVKTVSNISQEPISQETVAIARQILEDLLSEPTLFTLLKSLQTKGKFSNLETINLSNYGLVPSDEVSEERYLEGTWANHSPYYRIFTEKNTGETKIFTLRIKIDALVSAFDTQNDQPIEVQVITRNQNTPNLIKSSETFPISKNSLKTKVRDYAAVS